MKTYIAALESVSPYSSSRYHDHETPKLDRESNDAYEKRTWKHKLTTDKTGQVLINGSGLKFALDTAAKQLGKQVPGKGKRTYTAIFVAGILIPDHIETGINKDQVDGVWVHVNSDGVRGSGKRVMKCFPTVPAWSGKAKIIVLDEAITKEVLEEHLDRAGAFVGVGQYRPEKGGTNGRFKINSLKTI